MGKVNNALNMLMLLKSRNKMTRREIAEELEVDVRQISRYKEDLCMAGILIEEERGRYGGYSIKGKTAWINADLTEDEVKALELVINYIQEGFPLKSDFNSGMAKILSNYKLGDDNSSVSANINTSAHFKRLNRNKEDLKKKWIIINESIISSNKLKINYSNLKDENTIRIVRPYSVYIYQGANYMLAYCEYSNKLINFKLVRIREIEVLDEIFDKGNFEIKSYLNNRLGIHGDREKFVVKLKVYYPYAKCFKEHKWVTEEKIDDHYNEGYLFYSGNIEGKADIIKWVMEMGSNVEVLEPKEIKDEIINECKKIMRLYKA